MRRSMLFLPGNNPNMLINGNCLGADAVIFDLEDAVSPDEKDAARILVRNTMRYMDFRGCEIIVRINSIDTAYWQKDIDAILPQKPDIIMLPKTGTAEVGGGKEPNAVFTGFCTDRAYPLAFMVVVEDAGSGAKTGIPIASKVLAACKDLLDSE